MSLQTLETICDFAEAPVGRVDRVVQHLTGLSRSGVRGLFDHRRVSVNGELCTDSAATAAKGDIVRVRYDPQQRYKELPKAKADPAFDILFEDQHLLVVNKAAHVLTVPTAKGESNTLVHAIERHLNRGQGRKKAHVVHRLDRGTSGVLVFGKTHEMASKIKDQFEARKPERVYYAVVAGELGKKSGTFRSHLATDVNLNRYSTKDTTKGQLAVTHYEVIASKQGATLVKVRLETGRRNQIRVHFAEAGHPVLGDPRYRPDLSGHPRWRAKRLALHAAILAFAHPVTGKPLKFESPLPEEFSPFLASHRRLRG
jgi:23S rRNA pseudouridine1911/1915/1917 synthase